MFNLKWLTIAVGATLFLIFLTHLPPQMLPAGLSIKGLDKLCHFISYGLITLLFAASLRFRLSLHSAAVLFIAIALLGIIDEVTQPLVNRTASVMDLTADICGIAVILLLSFHITALRSRQSPKIDMWQQLLNT